MLFRVEISDEDLRNCAAKIMAQAIVEKVKAALEDGLAVPQLYSVTDAAQLLKVSPGWLRKRTAPGSKHPIPCQRIGKYVRFSRADLEAIGKMK